MKVKVVEDKNQGTFEKAVNLEVASLKSEGNKVTDIKFSTSNQTGLHFAAMVIYESK